MDILFRRIFYCSKIILQYLYATLKCLLQFELKYYLYFIREACSSHIYGVYIFCSPNWPRKAELLPHNSNTRTGFKHMHIFEAMI